MNLELLPLIFTELDMLVLERTGMDAFQPLQPMPMFVEQVFPSNEEMTDLGWDYTASAFLEHFMVDAKTHWASGTAEQLWSEFWAESDDEGKEHSFQAVALLADEIEFIVVIRLAEFSTSRQKLLQQARNNLLLQRYLEVEVEKRTQTLRKREEEIVLRLIGAADYRDEETGTHIRRMGLYAALMVRSLGWSSMKVSKMRLAASMHDVGKIGIPDGVLLKADRLTPPEFEIMKSHSLIGGKILEGSNAEVLRMAHEVAIGHHENWNGSGYPLGKESEDISIAARVVAICDVFDALAHDRVYRKALPLEDVLNIMRDLRGIKFDPQLFDLFMKLLPDMLKIKERYKDKKKRSQYVPIWET